MVENELKALINQIISRKCEEQTIEIKSAHKGCPEKLYDSISAFANQDSGGTIVFGIDEKNGFCKVGVYDPQDLQKKVMEYGEQMTPVVRPVFTVFSENGLNFVSAEIPPADLSERPCYKTAKGRLNGSYIRVGDADKPMTEYEVYSFEAYRKNIQDDIRTPENISMELIDKSKLHSYIEKRKENRPNLALMPNEQLYEMLGIKRKGKITLTALLLFGIYPQASFPQLGVIATAIEGTQMGVSDTEGKRFSDSKRIEGTLPEMLEGCLSFVRKNIRISTKIDSTTGERKDIPEYPMNAVREAILNALVHRDYSKYTESMPVQLLIFSDRIEIKNPGGLYGRITVDQLGKIQPDTRNPVLINAMEALGQTENRYSGIPSIYHAMKAQNLKEPVFRDSRTTFTVVLYNEKQKSLKAAPENNNLKDSKELLKFCTTPKTRTEIINHIGLSSSGFAIKHYLNPLIDAGLIMMTIPDKPKSKNQKYVTVK